MSQAKRIKTMENYKTIRPKIKVVVVAYEKCSLIQEVVTIGL